MSTDFVRNLTSVKCLVEDCVQSQGNLGAALLKSQAGIPSEPSAFNVSCLFRK